MELKRSYAKMSVDLFVSSSKCNIWCPPSAANMRQHGQWTGSALVQVVACRLIDTRPLPNLNQCCLIVNRILRNKPNKWGGGDKIIHDDVIKWKHFPRYWSFLSGIHRSPVERPVSRSLVFSLICAWTNGWANSRNGGDLRRHCARYDVTVIISGNPMLQLPWCCRDTYCISLTSESCHDANFVVTGGTGGCLFFLLHIYSSLEVKELMAPNDAGRQCMMTQWRIFAVNHGRRL